MKTQHSAGMASLLAAFVLAAGAMAVAGPFADFEGDLRNVYATYRSALFSTNQKDKAASERDGAALASGWNGLVIKWAKAAPPQYSDDPTFAPTLLAAAQTIAAANQKIAGGDLADAHDALEKIRDELGGLRQRNNITVFSDRMNEFHEEMEQILKLGRSDPDAATLAKLRGQTAVLRHLGLRLGAAPPPEAKTSAEFQHGLRGVMESVDALVSAVASGEPAVIRSALDGLKKPYAKLFLKFG